jgi:hypothetical protein
MSLGLLEKRRNMTKAAAERYFKEFILPGIKATERPGAPDYGSRFLAWDSYTDGLCKDGKISISQYEKWQSPKVCQRQR